MSDYGAPLEFGLSVTPEAADVNAIFDLVQVADSSELDLIAIQDHAYNHTFVDTWTLIAFLAARTRQIHFMPDVADLPLRPPPMLAKAVATLDRLTDGRVELAIGAGAFWDGIAAWVVQCAHRPTLLKPLAKRSTSCAKRSRSPVVSSHMDTTIRCLAITLDPVLRTTSASGSELSSRGCCNSSDVVLVGGSVQLNIYVPPAEVARSNSIIDTAAAVAGRNTSEIRRLYNVVGSIGPRIQEQGLNGPAELWIETLTQWASDLGIGTFVFWPRDASDRQVRMFAEQVVPGVLEEVNALRSTTAGTF